MEFGRGIIRSLSLQPIHGMSLPTLLRVLARNRFVVDARCLPRLGYLALFGVFNSICGLCETFIKAPNVDAVEIKHPPLFIIGHWRSGTTHLHNLLSLDANFACPTAFQALFPHHFLFTQAGGRIFDRLAPKTRPMDNMLFSSEVPHEDEFAVAAHSAVSPYLRILFPVTGDKGHEELDPKRLSPKALERWKLSLILFMKKVTASEGGRIVLKSPPHLGRVGLLHELFPGAQFIHIVRNPYEVYVSTRKLWKDCFSHGHLQIPADDDVDELILSWYSELFSLFERDKAGLPPGTLYELKFEDLESNPIGTLEALYNGLSLQGFKRFKPRVARYLETVSGYRKNDYCFDEKMRKKVRDRWGGTFVRYGYR